MQSILVVVRPFGAHAIGDLITTPDTITQILASDQANCVVKMIPPAAPATTPAASAAQTGA